MPVGPTLTTDCAEMALLVGNGVFTPIDAAMALVEGIAVGEAALYGVFAVETFGTEPPAVGITDARTTSGFNVAVTRLDLDEMDAAVETSDLFADFVSAAIDADNVVGPLLGCGRTILGLDTSDRYDITLVSSGEMGREGGDERTV